MLDRYRRSLPAVFAALILFAPCARAQQKTDTSALPYMNPALPIDQRVDDLIGRMTLEEKVQQMRDHAPAIPRLNVPKYDWWNEGLHGVAFAGTATNFPQVMGHEARAPHGRDHLHRGPREI
jgi:beta-glucosidase